MTQTSPQALWRHLGFPDVDHPLLPEPEPEPEPELELELELELDLETRCRCWWTVSMLQEVGI